MKITKTINELIQFNAVANVYIAKQQGAENKITGSIKNIGKEVQKIFDKYNEDVEDARLNNCAVNPADQTILREPSTTDFRGNTVPGNYKFTVAGQKKLNEDIKALLAVSVEVDSRIAEDTEKLIASMTEQEREMFSGLVIPVQLQVEA
jgi:hypothetical protein